jgi:two-component system response regulator YesN
MKLLIVDDDLNTVQVIRDSIEWDRLGFNDVLVAFGGTGAQKIILKEKPDVVLCDIEMPCGSGLDLLQWIRSEKLETEFIFLTCHENFEFAAQAIKYDAAGYVTKPFQPDKIVTTVCKAVRKIMDKKRLTQFSEYGKCWFDMQRNIEENFWRDVLFYSIPPDDAVVRAELKKRRLLGIAVQEPVRLFLVSLVKSQISPDWEPSSFQYALRNLCSEIVFGQPNMERCVVYDTVSSLYAALPVPDAEPESLRVRGSRCVKSCRIYLNCVVNCYIGRPCRISELGWHRKELEQIDCDTAAVNGLVLLQGETVLQKQQPGFSLDGSAYTELLESGEQLKVVNRLKQQLEEIAAVPGPTDFSPIYQDFSQILYSVLNRHEIQAHKVFEDDLSKSLSQNAVHSLFDMMKWANFASGRVVEIIKRTRQSKNVVEQAKNYIQENYSRHINRNDIAASVYLTPDYLSRLFKNETGLSLHDYLNRYRIQKANELLVDPNRCISEVAMQVGFFNISYFSTVYKKFTGRSPNEVRKTGFPC